MKTITSIEDFEQAKNHQASLFYFSHEQCNVCKVLLPKVAELIQKEFPKIKLFYIDTRKTPEIPAQNSIFTNPVILIFFDSREFYRKARTIGIKELQESISKPYNILFSKEE